MSANRNYRLAHRDWSASLQDSGCRTGDCMPNTSRHPRFWPRHTGDWWVLEVRLADTPRARVAARVLDRYSSSREKAIDRPQFCRPCGSRLSVQEGFATRIRPDTDYLPGCHQLLQQRAIRT